MTLDACSVPSSQRASSCSPPRRLYCSSPESRRTTRSRYCSAKASPSKSRYLVASASWGVVEATLPATSARGHSHSTAAATTTPYRGVPSTHLERRSGQLRFPRTQRFSRRPALWRQSKAHGGYSFFPRPWSPSSGSSLEPRSSNDGIFAGRRPSSRQSLRDSAPQHGDTRGGGRGAVSVSGLAACSRTLTPMAASQLSPELCNDGLTWPMTSPARHCRVARHWRASHPRWPRVDRVAAGRPAPIAKR